MLERIVKLQFEENTDYNKPSQAVNQMQSLNALSKDLYTESIRFIYELIQNADDSNIGDAKVSVSIRLFGKNLIIAHTGKPFDERDIRGICAVNDGTKKEDKSKTGFKGIGFKSVFGQSERVTVYSDGEYFRFDASYSHDWKWGDTQESWEESRGRSFSFPWQIIPIYTAVNEIEPEINDYLTAGKFTVATIVETVNSAGAEIAIRELSEKADMFLFLKNIEEIDFNLGTRKLIQINQIEDNEIVLKSNGDIKARYLVNRVVLTVPEKLSKELSADANVPDKLKLASSIEISFAAKIGTSGLEKVSQSAGLLYAYLPTEERQYKLPVLVNTAFLTTANRETLHADSTWNQWLFFNITKELFIWTSELVTSKFSDGAYELLPEKLDGDNSLVKEYNKGYAESLASLPFVLSDEGELLRIDEAIIDETFLISNKLFGKKLIRSFVVKEYGLQNINDKPFVPHRKYSSRLKALGVASFKWKNLPKLLASSQFKALHSVEKNSELIAVMENYSRLENPTEINDDSLQRWPFILDHKMDLKSPEEIFFPQVDDTTWNSPDSELSFLNPELQEWLDTKISLKLWLGRLGVVEKSDLTFFNKTILPNVSTFITRENALETIKSIFMLYKRNEISSEILSKLSEIRLLTTQGTLIPSNQSYFSSAYEPILDLQPILSKDFYLAASYISSQGDLSEWKRFFIYIGVSERIEITIHLNRDTRSNWIAKGFERDYFDIDDKLFWNNYFLADAYSGLNTSSLLLEMTADAQKAELFWTDVIHRIPFEKINGTATAFWGHSHKPSQSTGDKVSNYLKWYAQNKDCIATTNQLCLSSDKIFLNDPRIIEIAHTYLPIFAGPELDADWRSFFTFKTVLQLSDFLLILRSISEDSASDNKQRIQKIYEYLLENIANWDSAVREQIRTWALESKLLDKNGNFSPASSLKHYPDGDHSIFQGSFDFIHLNASNGNHPELMELLGLFGIEIIDQSSFKLIVVNEGTASALREKIVDIIPFWAKWRESDVQGGYEQMKYELETKLEKLTFKNADELTVTFGDNWSQDVSVYFKEDVFHVLKDWKANDVMLELAARLCRQFKSKKFDSELGFLLRSEQDEILRYFKRNNMEIPELKEKSVTPASTSEPSVFGTIDFKKSIDYQALWQSNLARNSELIASAEGDPKRLLLDGLQKQKPREETQIYHFSHIENAVAIIREHEIKSRQRAAFKDSAGSGIISQTSEDRKQYARFYFRSHTPTQYYVENWGRGQASLDNLNGEPVCPVPVFFIIPITDIIDSVDWKVSLGTMASQAVQYGNTFDIVSKFDFDGVYKMKSEINHDRYMAAAHQEFLVNDSLDLSDVDYKLAVQDDQARQTLLVMLGDDEKWSPLISVDPSLFYNDNPKIKIEKDDYHLSTDFGTKRDGRFVLQYTGGDQWTKISAHDIDQYSENSITTIITSHDINISSDLNLPKYNLHYSYKGQLWLIDTNNPESNTFDTGFIASALRNWMQHDDDPHSLITILKMHPELNDWFKMSIPGPDKLTLEGHTIAVMENYQKYFSHQQSLFKNEKIFLLFLALHDIGKPKAISVATRHEQHQYTLEIIDRISSILPIEARDIETIKVLINGDPIGKYLNLTSAQPIDTTVEEMIAMGKKLEAPFPDFYHSYVIYYQCDAAGYDYLIERLFETSPEGDFIKHLEKNRFVFKETQEAKFSLLEEKLDPL